MKILITGAAGFVGFHCAKRLTAEGFDVVGIDNLNDYYDVNLKHARLSELATIKNFKFNKLDLSDRAGVADIFEKNKFDVILHLGAQAGVRYSIDNPWAYIESNIAGTLSILEACRNQGPSKLLYASSSSVYGANKKIPFSVADRVDNPVSLYAATKKSNELMVETYAHLYGLNAIGLRFFTVYGPWGRPDMAYYKFADKILAGKAIDVYNNGDMRRDFTYVDDIVDGIVAMLTHTLSNEKTHSHAVYNLGNNQPEKLMDMIEILSRVLNKKIDINYLPMQPGDVYETFADITETTEAFGFKPKVNLEEGLSRFGEWYLPYAQKNNLN